MSAYVPCVCIMVDFGTLVFTLVKFIKKHKSEPQVLRIKSETLAGWFWSTRVFLVEGSMDSTWTFRAPLWDFHKSFVKLSMILQNPGWILYEPYFQRSARRGPGTASRSPKGSQKVHGEPFRDPESLAIHFLKLVYTSKIEPLLRIQPHVYVLIGQRRASEWI